MTEQFKYSFPRKTALSTLIVVLQLLSGQLISGEPTRLLRQPSISDKHIAFIYGSDLWVVDRNGGLAKRLTSTPAVESNPHLSPDGKTIAFTSNRSGSDTVYVMPVEGGAIKQLTWYPARDSVRGWSRDGKSVLYASTRETAPSGYDRLWTVPAQGGASTLLGAPFGHDGSFSPDGKQLVVEPVARWDGEWRLYRGGQNQPLIVLDLKSHSETLIPCERTTDSQPIWHGSSIYFLSDRDGVVNIWSYDVESKKTEQLTRFKDDDVKWASIHQDTLAFERQGFIHTLDLESGKSTQVVIEAKGDFPWADSVWKNVNGDIRASGLSPTGQRALFEARGEIFTVPVKKGDSRNLTRSSGAADRLPIWSPKGNQIAWFSDTGSGYKILIAEQDGKSKPKSFGIGESKMGWEATWSPDGRYIAFVDDDVRIRLFNVETGNIRTLDEGGANIERGSMGLVWAPDSKWLAYAKTFPNRFRRIVVCPIEKGKPQPLTDSLADAFAPSWSRDGKHLFCLASTNLALRSGWANTSQIKAEPRYGAYMILLDEKSTSPFAPGSDEEKVDDKKETPEESAKDSKSKTNKKEKPEPKKKKNRRNQKKKNNAAKDSKSDAKKDSDKKEGGSNKKSAADKSVQVKIDFNRVERRILALPLPVRDYVTTLTSSDGGVFIGERSTSAPGLTLHKYTVKDKKLSPFAKGVSSVSISSDGKKMLYRSGGSWSVVDTAPPTAVAKGRLAVSLRMKLDRLEEWKQIFEEAWHYQRDFFYDPGMHGRNWTKVRDRYAPLINHVRHRADLNYVLDQMNGELSVGHSFVSGGDLPDVDSSRVGTLGVDLVASKGRWQIKRILTVEGWNPSNQAPLDQPGLKVAEGNFLIAINGTELTDEDDPYRLLDGTIKFRSKNEFSLDDLADPQRMREGAAGEQTELLINSKPSADGAWSITVKPIPSESSLRRRAWVEDNRRLVDKLSGGKLAYVWVPNTGGPGLISFDRYLFAQQDKLGAVIDERFNGGGLLDDYMVDLMTRKIRAAVTNEVPNGKPFELPAGILGPKVLLINERAGSGGDFFPWVFRQQKAGKLIGMRTWGGLVKSSTHYPMVDGGRITAPDNAVFDPVNNKWIGENVGIAPDIEVRMDAKAVSQGRDPQIERGVKELLELLKKNPPKAVTPPKFPRPARNK